MEVTITSRCLDILPVFELQRPVVGKVRARVWNIGFRQGVYIQGVTFWTERAGNDPVLEYEWPARCWCDLVTWDANNYLLHQDSNPLEVPGEKQSMSFRNVSPSHITTGLVMAKVCYSLLRKAFTTGKRHARTKPQKVSEEPLRFGITQRLR